jgi:hypothetical protein
MGQRDYLRLHESDVCLRFDTLRRPVLRLHHPKPPAFHYFDRENLRFNDEEGLKAFQGASI